MPGGFEIEDGSVERPRRTPPSPFSPLVIMAGVSRTIRSPYNMLPEEPLKLSILKLDGSSFDVQVSKSATVADLKMAVQAAFSHERVSWPHLWAHFCLSYEDQKLIVDTDYLNYFGIKDGDQLRFIRHISISYNLTDAQTKKKIIPSKQQLYLSFSRSSSKQPRKSGGIEQMMNRIQQQHQKSVQNIVVNQNCKPGLLWKGLTSFAKLPMNLRTRRMESRGDIVYTSTTPSSSRFSDNLRKLFQSFLGSS